MATQTLRLLPPLSVPVALSMCGPKSNFLTTSSINLERHLSGMPLIYAKYSIFSLTERVSKIALYCGQYPISFLHFWKFLFISMP